MRDHLHNPATARYLALRAKVDSMAVPAYFSSHPISLSCAPCSVLDIDSRRLLLLKCADSRREVESLSSLLRETKAALGASKGELEVTMANHIKMLDRARKVGTECTRGTFRD